IKRNNQDLDRTQPVIAPPKVSEFMSKNRAEFPGRQRPDQRGWQQDDRAAPNGPYSRRKLCVDEPEIRTTAQSQFLGLGRRELLDFRRRGGRSSDKMTETPSMHGHP
ncbi:unnamed protein product, partial [marine sediment metagenome]